MATAAIQVNTALTVRPHLVCHTNICHIYKKYKHKNNRLETEEGDYVGS